MLKKLKFLKNKIVFLLYLQIIEYVFICDLIYFVIKKILLREIILAINKNI